MFGLARGLSFFALVCGLITFSSGRLGAAPFNKTTVIKGTYLMGTDSLAEYDYYELAYPGYAPGFAFTFSKNGTVVISDTQSDDTGYGTYTRFQGNSRIRVTLTSPASPWGQVTYELYRVGNTSAWWGEVRIAGDVWGHFRGIVE